MSLLGDADEETTIDRSWVVLSATFGIQTAAIISAGDFHGITWAPLVILTFLIFVYVSMFTIIFGGASFNPTGSVAFYVAGIPGDTLFSLAIRLPAQAQKSSNEDEAPAWAPLHDNYMLANPKLKDWDKKQETSEGDDFSGL